MKSKKSDGWHVYSEKGKYMGGPYKTEEQADKRLRQMEFFKHINMQKSAAMKAYFIGITPPSYIQEHVPTQRVKSDLHITLSYLGKRKKSDEKAIIDEIRKTVEQQKNFEVNGPFFGAFKNKYPHVGFEKNKRLMSLVDAFNSNPNIASHLSQNYAPHMTIGKYNNLTKKFRNHVFKFPVNQVTLFSTMPSKDKNYTEVAKFDLKKRNFIDKLIDYFQYT